MASAVWKEIDEILINSVRDYPCLYNCKLKELKDNRIKENAWKKVAAELNSSGNIYDRITHVISANSMLI